MSSEPKKVDRRKFIYAGLGAVALIAIGAAAYVAMNPPVVTQTVTTSTTVPTTSVVTTTVPTTSVITTTVPTTTVITTTPPTTWPKPEVRGKWEIHNFWVGSEKFKHDFLITHVKECLPNIEIAEVLYPDGEKMVAGVMSAILAGKPPSTFQSDAGYWLYTLLPYLVPIDDLVKEEGWDKAWFDGVKTLLTVPWGKIYPYPYNLEIRNVLWYNKSILDKFNIDPASFKKMDDFWQACETIKASGVWPLVYSGNPAPWAIFPFHEGIVLSSDDKVIQSYYNRTLTAEEYKPILQQYLKWIDYSHPESIGLRWDEAAAKVYKGEAAMYLCGSWALGYYKNVGWTYGKELGTFMLPGAKFSASINGWPIVKGCDEKVAREVLKALSDRKFIVEANVLTGNLSAFKDVDPTPYDDFNREMYKKMSTPGLNIYPGNPDSYTASLRITLGEAIVSLITTRNIDEAAKKIYEIRASLPTA